MFCIFFFGLIVAGGELKAELPWIRISDDGKGFVESETDRPFVPWGFNYDRDTQGQLIEDYWVDQWQTVEEDFQEMKSLGANVVRVHLQFGAFMETATSPRQQSLEQLKRLLDLAERTGLYLNLTGLGCYHKQDVPPWYDLLGESERWDAQAAFWQAIAKVCTDSSVVFCYDLMNEPVVTGGDKRRDDWLGAGFGGKHFVQFISLDRKGRVRHEVAQSWIEKLVAAIRQVDSRHLITVGMVHWSLDRPGLTSGFVPDKVSDKLDFLSVHIYPESGKLDEATETLRAFAAVGKPVVIEEIFPLKCKVSELETFIIDSRSHASGWFGFYWGTPPKELDPSRSIGEAITRQWLELFQAMSVKDPAAVQ
ncbi:MAG TPA: hypothetical protein DDZ51_00885 [Planctomycetaceae bacterium]|nr:hypothetical protein [Planctomycetaceae bacterium]